MLCQQSILGNGCKFKMIDLSQDLQNQIDLLSDNNKKSLYKILRSQGIQVTLSDGKVEFDSQTLTPKVIQVISHMKKDEVFVIPPKSSNISESRSESSSESPTIHDYVRSSKPTKTCKEKRVTIMEDVISDSDTTNQNKTDIYANKAILVDIDDIERRMKQNITYKPSQLRIKRKMKDLLKKIAKHKHACPEKNYGQELNDREDELGDIDSGTIVIEDNLESGEAIEEQTIMEDDDEENGDEDDKTDIVSDEDDIELSEDNDDEVDTDHTDDASSVPEDTDDCTDVDDEILENMMESEITSSLNEVDHTRLNFQNTTMKERFMLYKGLLECNKKMDFGNIDDLGL